MEALSIRFTSQPQVTCFPGPSRKKKGHLHRQPLPIQHIALLVNQRLFLLNDIEARGHPYPPCIPFRWGYDK